jgi:hypothetical protein
MGKLKRLSSEIVGILFLEGLSFSQILSEMESFSKEEIKNTLDVMVHGGVLRKRKSKYFITDKAKELFSCWE